MNRQLHNDKEVRLSCLELATGYGGFPDLEIAQYYYDWVDDNNENIMANYHESRDEYIDYSDYTYNGLKRLRRLIRNQASNTRFKLLVEGDPEDEEDSLPNNELISERLREVVNEINEAVHELAKRDE